MKHIHKTIFITDDYYTSQYFSDGFVFFDIETTGLSSKTSFIYLIGLAVRENGRILSISSLHKTAATKLICSLHFMPCFIHRIF